MKSLTAFLGAVGMACCFEIVCAQVSTVQPGNWNSPATWSGGIIPDSNHGTITIAHAVIISDTVFTVDEIVLQNSLTIEEDAEIILSDSGKPEPDFQLTSGGILNVLGKIACADGAVFSGTTSLNTFFKDGAVYEHRYFSTAGEPPVALWDANSTLIISGYRTSRSLNTTGWTQVFGNVEYNCPAQEATTFVEMLGNLRNIQGNFHIRNTNGGVLRLTLDRTTLNTINIGGNFSIDGNSEVWFSREANTIINIGGNFEYRSTATPSSYLTTQGTCQVNVDGNVLINTPGILRFASSGGGTGTLRFRKNFDLQTGTLAVLNPGRGFIECNGEELQSISCSGSVSSEITFQINNSKGVEIKSSSIGQSGIQVAKGELTLPETISLQGDLIVDDEGSLRSNETTLLLSGSAHQIIKLMGDTLKHITINKLPESSVTLESMTNLSGQLLIQSQHTDVLSSGNLTLLSSTDDGNEDASIGRLPEGSAILGDVTIQRFMSGEGRIYRYLSSPVTNASVSSMQDDFPVTGTFENPSAGAGINSKSPSCYWYDESLPGLSGWIPYPASGLSQDNMLEVGKGYIAFIRQAAAPTIWDVSGPVNQGAIDLHTSFTQTVDAINDGWNLIGNPYPSSIDWSSEAGWIKTNIADGIAVRDNGSGTILYWDGDIGSLGNGRIAKGQSFWVKTNGENPSLIINEDAKTNMATPFFKKSNSDLDFIELTIASSTYSDKVYLRLRHDAVAGLDNKDVQKRSNDVLNLAFLIDSVPAAIAATNRLTCSTLLPLNLSFPLTSSGTILPSLKGEYSFSLNAFGLFKSSSIKIHDALTNEFNKINEDNYIFTVTDDTASYAHDRFSLYLEADNSTEELVIRHDSVFCEPGPYSIKVENLSQEVRSTIFLNGAEQKSILLSGSTSHEILLDHTLFSNEMNIVSARVQNVCHDLYNEWTVSAFSEPVITQNGNLLVSSYPNGNRWYFEHNLIGDLQIIEPRHSGVYTLRVNSGNCHEESTYDFLFQANEILLFPNPVIDNISITSPRDAVITFVSITDAYGKIVKEIRPDIPFKHQSVSLSELSPGFYLATAHTSKGRYVVKVIKE
ncbi:MAG TPA: T9SS type A sorting domain-containing protein [Ohtaekwangia sp.]